MPYPARSNLMRNVGSNNRKLGQNLELGDKRDDEGGIRSRTGGQLRPFYVIASSLDFYIRSTSPSCNVSREPVIVPSFRHSDTPPRLTWRKRV